MKRRETKISASSQKIRNLIAEIERLAAQHNQAFEKDQGENRVNLENMRNNYSALSYNEEWARIMKADDQYAQDDVNFATLIGQQVASFLEDFSSILRP